MIAPREQERILVVALRQERQRLMEVFAGPVFPGWEVLEADSLEAALSVLESIACDVVLVDQGVCRPGFGPELASLGSGCETALLVLADAEPEVVAEALEHGARQWLPREEALNHPGLLLAALHQARRWNRLAQECRLAGEALQECRRQVNRLVGLLWEAGPVDTRTRWFTQRYMLERLQEEVARAERYRTPLAVALGFAASGSPDRPSPILGMADRLARAKRRADVVGHYGRDGFMLLLTHTSKEGAVACCRRLKDLLEQPPHPVIAYFGVASLSPQTPSARSLLSQAEGCLEKARTAGSDRVVY
ncbi:MAG TPA: diguanylate cyclase [Gemmataceae bacterium]|nr:diguanylate cyclase [Gemmataceae bacterium]